MPQVTQKMQRKVPLGRQTPALTQCQRQQASMRRELVIFHRFAEGPQRLSQACSNLKSDLISRLPVSDDAVLSVASKVRGR